MRALPRKIRRAAVSNALSQASSERDAKIFELQMEQFWKRWAPDDKYEAATFHAELSSLIRQVYRDAQEPMLKQWSAALAAMPMPPFIKGKP